MAISQRAWTFDAPAFTRAVAALLAAGDLRALRKAARKALDAATPEVIATLQEMGFDSEWVAAPNRHSDRSLESLAILLAARLERAPAVSPVGGGHLAVADALQSLGWTADERSLLLRGRLLETMFPRDLARFFAGAGQYGGWISRADAAHMQQRLESTSVAALSGAREMLDAAHRRDADLFVLLN